MTAQIRHQFSRVAIALLFASSLSGCIYKMTGNTMGGYAAEHLVPYMMASDDVNMACQTGVSLGSFLMSFERVNASPDRAALVSLQAAGMCAEAKAWEAELRRLRAASDRRPSEAQDALTEEKREHQIAAHRFYDAYRRLAAFVGPAESNGCPKIDADDEVLYLLGLSAGVLAVLHDKGADGTAGVPTDIPATVERTALCVSDDRWWGVPSALRAAIWIAAPPFKPKDADPWKTLEASAKKGAAMNVRLASAFQIQGAVTAGKADLARQLIAAFAATVQAAPSDPHWKLLDAYGTNMITHESDKIWTEETGHRTPFNALGTFQNSAAAPEKEENPFAE